MTFDITRLPPLPALPDLPPCDTVREPPADPTDPLAVMRSNLKFWIHHGENIAARMAAIADDPLRSVELDQLGRQYLNCRDKAQAICCDLAPFCFPRMANQTYTPPPKPAASGSLADAITDDMSGIEAAEVYRRLVRGG
jgi:hypothetical protein